MISLSQKCIIHRHHDMLACPECIDVWCDEGRAEERLVDFFSDDEQQALERRRSFWRQMWPVGKRKQLLAWKACKEGVFLL